ncbi:hypothetical protein EMIT093MI4_110065 [Pseudomonas sp. IT-93MI4]
MGAGLLAKTVDQSTSLLPEPPPSRASPLPQWTCDSFDYGLALAHAFITVLRFGLPAHDCPSNWFPDLAQH